MVVAELIDVATSISWEDHSTVSNVCNYDLRVGHEAHNCTAAAFVYDLVFVLLAPHALNLLTTFLYRHLKKIRKIATWCDAQMKIVLEVLSAARTSMTVVYSKEMHAFRLLSYFRVFKVKYYTDSVFVIMTHKTVVRFESVWKNHTWLRFAIWLSRPIPLEWCGFLFRYFKTSIN